MDRSPSAHSPDAKESGSSFRKPANEASRRNYRRHSPSSSHSRSPSPGGWKRDRSPSLHEDGSLKKGRNKDADSGKGREDGRSRRANDRSLANHSRDNHGRAEDYDRNYSRKHSGHYERNYQNLKHTRTDYLRYEDARYSRRSPDRLARERNFEDSGYRRRETRERDGRVSDGRSIDRDRWREQDTGARERYKTKDKELLRGHDRHGEKYRDDGLNAEAEQLRHGKRIDNENSFKDGYSIEGQDYDTTKMECKQEATAKGREGKAREKEEGAVGRDYSSDEDGHYQDTSRERSYRQDHSKMEDVDKKHANEKGRCKISSLEPGKEFLEASVAFDNTDESKKSDEKFSKGSKWGPEGETLDPTAAPSDPQMAKMAAMKAAALVNINLGGFKTIDEKKKLLWGSKDQKPAAASGTNRWDTVRFADRDRQEKFNKLMGVKGEVKEDRQEGANTSFTSEKQEELQQDLEKQFTAGLRRRDGRTVGLGL
ncbi:hypothetical protein KP509_04G043100 [Ceratopteris richardii]|uniref:Small acidic protein-like domain-containing protein n=1 Tax=Ceratopteris richardii TaxID=49495 RepID=A0A8T2UWF0_CERRI|nr:hypothetical protein KP509_04G043100 [Ceratopteris richardii]